MPCRVIPVVRFGAALTAMLSVALLERAPGSVTLTWKVFAPTLPGSGVPESSPPVVTDSQAGPVTFAEPKEAY